MAGSNLTVNTAEDKKTCTPRHDSLHLAAGKAQIAFAIYQSSIIHLIDSFRRAYPDIAIRSFEFRSQAPLFGQQRAELRLERTDSGGELTLSSDEHAVCMKATIRA
jgi:hypothetical protein